MDKIFLKELFNKFHDKIEELIDDDQCGACEDEDIEMYENLFFSKLYTTDGFIKELGISRRKFNEYRSKGIIPDPIKISGVKINFWYKRLINKTKRKIELLNNK